MVVKGGLPNYSLRVHLAQLLTLAQLFKRMPGEALGAGVQLGLLSAHDVGNQLSCF